MNSKINKIFLPLIILLIIFAVYCSLSIGWGWDEIGQRLNGGIKLSYLLSLGKIELKETIFIADIIYQPSFFDTTAYALSVLLIKFVPDIYTIEIMHLINLSFSLLTLLGLYLLAKKLFNQSIAFIAVFLCLIDPFFFGHMSINPKDPIIAFAFVWSFLSLYLYCANFNKSRIKYLLASSFFFGFGIGTRVAFIIPFFPIAIFTLIYLFKFYDAKLQYF